jgi:pilus assembly protein CpaF
MQRDQVYQKTLRHFFKPVADLLFERDDISEILINGHDKVYCERAGRLELTGRSFPSAHALEIAVRNLSEYVGRRLDEHNHSMDARLPPPDAFRVHAIIPPCSRVGICLSIRKFGKKNETTLDWVVKKGSLSPMAAEYLGLMVQTHKNIVVSGGTGSGKTSLLNALSFTIPTHERIVVIEDSSELQLAQEHTVYLEAKQKGADGKGAVSIRDLFVDSLRMRPDRIIVGEVRRGEALDLIQSMLSGHDGSLSTVHASSPLLALIRLETLCLMSDVVLPVYVARMQVAQAMHVITQISRMPDGSRKVVEISEGNGLGPGERYRLRPIFKLVNKTEGGSDLVWTGKSSRFAQSILHAVPAEKRPLTTPVWQAKPSAKAKKEKE